MALPNYISNSGDGMGSPALRARQQQAQQQQQQQTAAQQQAALQQYGPQIIQSLNSGDYNTAWKDAIASESAWGGSQSVNTGATDPLIEALESSQGLHAIDPTLKMSSQQIGQYYDAFSAQTGTNPHGSGGTGLNGNLVGKNPYGLWGNAANSTAGVNAQAAVNEQQEGGIADISRFLGAKPSKSFLGKYGMDIAALAATVVSFGVAAPALAGALAADGIATGLAAGAIAGGVMGGINTLAVDAITGKPITAGGVLGGALGGAAGGGLQGLASGAINDATGLGTTVSGGLAGAGIGAAKAGLTGGNIGMGALTGGIGGAVQGSGITGNIKSGLTGAGLSNGVAGAVTNMGTNFAIGGVTGLAAGALMGSNGQPVTAAPHGAVQPNYAQQQTTQNPYATALGGGAPQLGGTTLGPNGQPVPQQTVNGTVAQQPNNGSNFFSNGLQSTMLGGGAMQGSSIPGGQTGSNIAAGSPMGVPGAQGSNGNMATSTDTSLAGTITGALPGVLNTAAGVYGSQNAAEKMTQADQNAINTQQSTMGNINNIWGTQQQLGQGADTALGKALGTNGQPADYSGFENMPGYQFAVSQGTQAIQRQAAAMGNAYTPNTAAAVGQYVTGTASQDYNTYIQQLMGAAGLGTTANQGLQTGQQTTGNNISTLQQNQGYAQASGVMGASTAVGGAFGPNGVGTSLIGAAGKYLNGGAGGSTGGGGGGGSGGMNPNQPVGPNNPMNYNGQNPNGTTGDGTAADPYGANASQYNANPANGYDPSNPGYDPNTIGNIAPFDPNSVGQPDWANFDPSTVVDDGGSFDPTSFLGDDWP